MKHWIITYTKYNQMKKTRIIGMDIDSAKYFAKTKFGLNECDILKVKLAAGQRRPFK